VFKVFVLDIICTVSGCLHLQE